jgi:hypothetical protein
MIEWVIAYVIILGAYTVGLVYTVRRVRRQTVQSLTKLMASMTLELDKIVPPVPRPEDSIFFEGEDYDATPATIPFRKHGTR